MQGEVKLEDRQLGTKDYFIVDPRTIATTFVLKTATTVEANQPFKVIAKYLKEEEVEQEWELDYFTSAQGQFFKIGLQMEQLYLFSQFSCLFQSFNHLHQFQRPIQN